MAEYLVKWPPGREPISKIGPLDGCGKDAVPLAGERWHDFHGFGCHLGNVGLVNQMRALRGVEPSENFPVYALKS